MKKLVVVADDFGWTKGVNEGILKGYKEGIVTEVSLMLSSPATSDAVETIKKERIRDVGLHLGLVGWDKAHKFLTRDDYKNLFKQKSDNAVADLIKGEIDSFEKLVGFKPTHIAPQYGIHGNLKVLETLMRYALDGNIPVRIPKTALMGGAEARDNYAAEVILKRMHVKRTDFLFGHVLGADLDGIKEKFLGQLSEVPDGRSAEMLTHPGYFDAEILEYTSLGFERSRDLALVLDNNFKKSILGLGFKFVNYSAI